MEAEKRIRREIANSNERRRMQSINAGFQSLRTLLPRHEGEKLSKAAILQQTAEYIYLLEQEKTRLLSQNSQLKRLLNQHEGGDVSVKKRKGEIIVPDRAPLSAEILADCQTMSESSIDASGNRTPEPGAVAKLANVVQRDEMDLTDLRLQLDREKRMRLMLEDQLRTLESQIYPDNLRDLSHQITLQYENSEVIEQADGLREMVSVAIIPEETVEDDRINPDDDMHLIALDIPPIGELRTVSESGACSRTVSPVDMTVEDDRSTSPPLRPDPCVKVEPKIEADAPPGPGPASPEEPSRLFLANTSRQNLETIVEAIRHLEGDHMFAEEQPGHEQDLPLALTNKPDQQRRIRLDVNDFLQYHQPQSRPGVIVVKHS